MHKHAMHKHAWIGAGTVFLMLGVGCASTSPNKEKLTDARASVQAAQEVGVENRPDAALHVQLAQEQIQKAEKLFDDGEADEGNRMLDRAKVDAELALELAKADAVRSEAQDARNKVDELKREQTNANTTTNTNTTSNTTTNTIQD